MVLTIDFKFSQTNSHYKSDNFSTHLSLTHLFSMSPFVVFINAQLSLTIFKKQVDLGDHY